jgi:hypothetical protein
VNTVGGVFPDILAGEVMASLVAFGTLCLLLLGLFGKERLILLDIFEGSRRELLRVILLVNACRAAGRLADGLLHFIGTSTALKWRVDSRLLLVTLVVLAHLVGSKDGGNVFMLLIINSSLNVSRGAILRVLRVINMNRLLTIRASNLRLERKSPLLLYLGGTG